jgi:TRAP-type C4-dicarboxylate transport system permease small subunit
MNRFVNFFVAKMKGDPNNTKPDPVYRLIDFITAILFIGLLLAALSQILFRFVLRISVPWTEELARVFYVYVTFLGLILLEADDNSIKVTFLIDKLPFKQRLAVQVLLNLFGIFFMICLFIGAFFMFINAHVMSFGTMTWLPWSALYLPIVIACPLTIYYLIRQLFRFQVKKYEDEDEVAPNSIEEEGTT